MAVWDAMSSRPKSAPSTTEPALEGSPASANAPPRCGRHVQRVCRSRLPLLRPHSTYHRDRNQRTPRRLPPESTPGLLHARAAGADRRSPWPLEGDRDNPGSKDAIARGIRDLARARASRGARQ